MALSEQKVLVTGATGFLGGVLARRLVSEGVRVRGLVRSPEKAAALRDYGIEIVQGDVTDADAMQRAVEGCNIVFHAAAALGGDYTKQQLVNVAGTSKVVRAAHAARVERFVHISSVAVYGYRVKGEVTEAIPPAPGADPYARTKSEAERVVIEGGVPYTIVRPAMIYGAGSINWTGNFFRWGRMKPTLFPGKGKGSAFPIHVDDVVDMTVKVASHPAGVNEIFNCAPDPAPTWREFVGAYSRLAGHDRWLSLPMPPFHLLAKVARVFAPKASLTQDLPDVLKFAERNITYKMTKARTLLGWTPTYDLERGVASCAPWLREQGLLK